MNIPNPHTCKECGITKPSSDFSKRTRSKNGLQPKCKECNKKDNDTFRELKPEYWSYEDGYFSDKDKWKYITLYTAADKTIKIYMISFPDGSKYIGSTKALLSVRLNGHLQDYKRVKRGKSKRVFPLLHAKFDEFQNIDDLVHHVKNNTSIIEECVGSKTKQYTLEAKWIKRLKRKGETLLNKSLPRRYENIKI
jgi:hypothetical protein